MRQSHRSAIRPALGEIIPDVTIHPANAQDGVEYNLRSGNRSGTLIAFLSTTCRACETIVGPLEEISGGRDGLRVIVIMRSTLSGCAEFIRLFGIRSLLVCDVDAKLTKDFDVHRNPFALLYDNSGVLVKKNTIGDVDSLSGLLVAIPVSSAPESSGHQAAVAAVIE